MYNVHVSAVYLLVIHKCSVLSTHMCCTCMWLKLNLQILTCNRRFKWYKQHCYMYLVSTVTVIIVEALTFHDRVSLQNCVASHWICAIYNFIYWWCTCTCMCTCIPSLVLPQYGNFPWDMSWYFIMAHTAIPMIAFPQVRCIYSCVTCASMCFIRS